MKVCLQMAEGKEMIANLLEEPIQTKPRGGIPELSDQLEKDLVQVFKL
ncbi:MAG: hypothetical protein JSS02_24025, partial [Planctomycetes bacterium]|nr:hypothetical protein [Planctomycetota bacterium]